MRTAHRSLASFPDSEGLTQPGRGQPRAAEEHGLCCSLDREEELSWLLPLSNLGKSKAG